MAASSEVETGFLANLLSSAGGDLTLDEFLSRNSLNLTADSVENNVQPPNSDIDLDFLLGAACDARTENTNFTNVRGNLDEASSFDLEDLLKDCSISSPAPSSLFGTESARSYFSDHEEASKISSKEEEDESDLASLLFEDSFESKQEESGSENICLSFADLCLKPKRQRSSSEEDDKPNPTTFKTMEPKSRSCHLDSGYTSDERVIDGPNIDREEKDNLPRIFLNNRRFQGQPSLIKSKPSLFCKVLCAKPRKRPRNLPPVTLHQVLKSLNYWQFFAFDTESPDDVINSKQKEGLSSCN